MLLIHARRENDPIQHRVSRHYASWRGSDRSIVLSLADMGQNFWQRDVMKPLCPRLDFSFSYFFYLFLFIILGITHYFVPLFCSLFANAGASKRLLTFHAR